MESTSLPLYHKRGPKSLQKRRYSRPSPPQDQSGLEFIKKSAESAAVYILVYPTFVKTKMFSTEFELKTVLFHFLNMTKTNLETLEVYKI